MQPSVAIAKTFLEALYNLPKAQQRKARQMAEKFREDPTSSGLNFERISDCRDSKMRSLRVDQAYRAIVVHPPRGDVFVLAYVARHDDAYDWAKSRRFDVHPRSGVLQFYRVEEVAPPAEESVADETHGLFAHHDDEELVLAGVPIPLLAAVRAVEDDDGLEALTAFLPSDATDVLIGLAAGMSLSEALAEASQPEPSAEEPVDTDDFARALDKPQTQRELRLVEDRDDLEAMLEAPLEQWRVFLHPSQRSIVQMQANGPVRVLGGAGTGKTVALMHRARYLAREVFAGEGDRLLVTTYSRNLAFDLARNLRNLCGPEFERFEIQNLHSWAVGYLRRDGRRFKILAQDNERRRLLEAASDDVEGAEQFPVSFYLDEWDRVVQAQELESLDDYLGARRTGRGVRIGRRQRALVWNVFRLYRAQLDERRLVEWEDVLREARGLLESNGPPTRLSAVLADEAQDFTPSGLRLLRALAPESPNTLFLAGDGHQRIYCAPVTLSSCGIEIRGRSRRLKINYRTTSEIRDVGVGILEGRPIDDLDGENDSLDGYRSLRHGPRPEIVRAADATEERKEIERIVRKWFEEGASPESICLAARTNELVDSRCARVLEEAGIPHHRVEHDAESDDTAAPGVRIATMHRLKGLEFPRVLLAGVKARVVPLARHASAPDDDVSNEEWELQERCLFYVATTRARDELAIVGSGDESPFLADLVT